MPKCILVSRHLKLTDCNIMATGTAANTYLLEYSRPDLSTAPRLAFLILTCHLDGTCSDARWFVICKKCHEIRPQKRRAVNFSYGILKSMITTAHASSFSLLLAANTDTVLIFSEVIPQTRGMTYKNIAYDT